MGMPIRLLHGLMALLNIIGAIWVVLIMLLVVVDVTGRAFFNAPLFGVPEIVKISVVGLVWCQMAHTLKINAHLRSTILVERLPPGARTAIEFISFVLGAITFALIVYSGWDNTLESWRIGEYEGEEPVRVPTYPIRSLVLLGAALTAVQFALLAVDRLRGRKSLDVEAPF